MDYRDRNKQRIIEAFAKLALRKSYQSISLREISELSGVSTTSFYTYFDSKDDMLKYYMEYSLDRLDYIIKNMLSQLPGIPNRVRGIIYVLSTLAGDEGLLAFHRVFREVEFIKEELAGLYYKRLFKILENIFSGDQGIDGEISPRVFALAAVGSSEFIHLFRKIFGVGGNIWVDMEVAGDLLLKGLGRESAIRISGIRSQESLTKIIEEYGIYRAAGIPENRWRIVSAAIDVISSKGFRESKIYEIMEKAGYSVGMFYKFYRSKEELLRDLVAIIGKALRRYLTICTSEASDPVELEAMGTACFLSFIRGNGNIYRIVRESEYIDLEIAKMYYIPFFRSYAHRLGDEVKRGAIRSYNPGSLAIALMGINHMAGASHMILGEPSESEIIGSLSRIYTCGLLRSCTAS